MGDMALAAVVVQPEVAGGLETASDISSGIEVGARVLKAAITKDPKDFEKAKKTGIKNGASWFVGFSLGTPAKKISDEASTAGEAHVRYNSTQTKATSLNEVLDKAAQKMSNLENAIKDYCIEKTLEIYRY